MGVFHFLKIVQMVPNHAKHHICNMSLWGVLEVAMPGEKWMTIACGRGLPGDWGLVGRNYVFVAHKAVI